MSIICIGDFGTGTEMQYKVSKLMSKIINIKKTKFILGLGDNIYPVGVENIKDEQFITKFEEPYKNISDKVKFYNVLGNHDYYGNYQAQIDYTKKSKKWQLKSNYYTFTKKFSDLKLEFYAIDSNLYQESLIINNKYKKGKEQEKWLISLLNKSKKQKGKIFRIVYGHHPWRSSGSHGNAKEKYDKFLRKIYNTCKFDLYLSGHDHINEHINMKNYPEIFISGTGGDKNVFFLKKVLIFGKSLFDINNSKYYSTNPGFLTIDYKKGRVIIEIHTVNNSKKSCEYKYSIKI